MFERPGKMYNSPKWLKPSPKYCLQLKRKVRKREEGREGGRENINAAAEAPFA